MKSLIRILCALMLVSASGVRLAAAQGVQRGADPEGRLIDELIVTGRMASPAWWRVSDQDSTVWVLGLPAGLPKGTSWNERSLKDRLSHARSLILPPLLRVAPLKAIGFFVAHRKALKSSAPLEQTLPPALARRFAAARTSLGQDARRYAGWKPVVAGVILDGDLRKSVALQNGQPLNRIRDLARSAHVREQRAASYDASVILKTMLSISDQAQYDCLEDSLSEAEAGAARVRSASIGWTRGDVRAALAMERGYDRCFAALPAVSALIERSHAGMADAIAAALAQPGESVAVVDLRALLASGGVLDRLKTRGFTVATPATVSN